MRTAQEVPGHLDRDILVDREVLDALHPLLDCPRSVWTAAHPGMYAEYVARRRKIPPTT